MKFFVCIREYYFWIPCIDGEFQTLVHYGQMFCVEHEKELPRNDEFHFSRNFQEINLSDFLK